LLIPLLTASAAGQPLEPALLGIVRSFGFESFVYGIATSSRPNRDSKSSVWTSLPSSWVKAYEENAYVEIDPRVKGVFDRASPFQWDAASIDGPPRVRQFLDHAAQYGIRSGVVVAFNGLDNSRIGFGLNSPISPVPPERSAEITGMLGTLMILGTRLHDLFLMQAESSRGTLATLGKALSRRERQCLEMAARGLTSDDIGYKLGITGRGVNFHFGNILGKLAAINRNEAIAKAVAQGLIRP
jgi:DNA-binding CsgD family transcriptional regulator